MVQAIGSFGDVERGEDGLVDLSGGPAADVAAAVQEHIEEADGTRVVDCDARIANRAGQGEALQVAAAGSRHGC